MNLTARLKNNKLEVFDVQSGMIKRSLPLPPGKYSGLVVAGDNATVTITPVYGRDRLRTYNIKTGAIISDLQM